jgi:hypothetical protein
MRPLLQLATALANATLASAHGPWSRAIGYDSGRIAGIKYASAKHPGGLNLVVFPDRIPVAAGNFLEVYDPHGNLAQRLGP